MFSQLFGDPCDVSNEGNIFSALEFNSQGDLLASGDHGGRVIIYERNKNDPKKVTTTALFHLLLFTLKRHTLSPPLVLGFRHGYGLSQ
jgi:hypothetical protein